jgi:hypothetical protein
MTDMSKFLSSMYAPSGITMPPVPPGPEQPPGPPPPVPPLPVPEPPPG